MADDKRRIVDSLEGDTTEWSTISAISKRDTGIFQEVTVELSSGSVSTSPLGPMIDDASPEILGFTDRTDADGTLIVWRDAGATQWRLPNPWHNPDAYPSGIDPETALTLAVVALRQHGHEGSPPSARPDCPLRCREAATVIHLLERLSDHMKAAGSGVLGQIGGAIAVRDATLDAFFAGVLFAKVWARASEEHAARAKRNAATNRRNARKARAGDRHDHWIGRARELSGTAPWRTASDLAGEIASTAEPGFSASCRTIQDVLNRRKQDWQSPKE